MASLISLNLTNVYDYFINQLKLIPPLFNKLIKMNCSNKSIEEVRGPGNL
jgi:hypothetical protein